MKKVLLIGIPVLILLIAGYWIHKLYWKADNFLDQIYLVPKDAVYIVEMDNPFENWEKFSKSKPWQYLRKQPKMAEIESKARTLDSVLHENKTLLGLVGKRNLIISAHIIRKSDYDFLFIFDLQKASKADIVKDQIEVLFRALNYKVTSRKFKGESIHELYDPIERTTLYMTFVDNHVVCSFTGLLIESAINEKESPTIGRDLYFIDIKNKVPESGLCRIYLNYKYLGKYATLMTGTYDAATDDLFKTLCFTGLDFNVSEDAFSLKGYTNVSDSTDSYLPALLMSGKNKITVQKVLSSRTALFAVMAFDNADKFVDNVENVLKQNSENYLAYEKNKNLIENYLKIDIRKNFFRWMDGEVAFVQFTPGKLGRQNEFACVVKMKNKKEAIENLNYIEDRIRKRTPVKFKTIEYEGYEVHYMEIKGFFKLMFGKMFNRMDKPYYTIIDDYVIFSNSTETLLSMIEDYRNESTLKNDAAFNDLLSEFNSRSSAFVYISTEKLFPLLREFTSPQTWREIQDNKDFLLCFSQIGFQLTGEKNIFETRLIARFAEPEQEDKKEELEEIKDFIEREDTIKNLERFYLEKLQGNVFTEHYDNGSVKSQTEMSNGLKNGKHKAFYESGKLKVVGKFKGNKRNGTWRFYNENGKLEYKERWKNGTQVDKKESESEESDIEEKVSMDTN